MSGCLQRGVGRLAISALPAKRDIVRRRVPDGGGRLRGARRPRIRGARFVFDLDLLGGGDRLRFGRRHHGRDGLSDMADAICRQRRPVRFWRRRAIGPRETKSARDGLQSGRLQIGGGDDRNHAFCRARRRGIDSHDPGMGVGRARKRHMQRSFGQDVRRIAARTGNETAVLPAFLILDLRYVHAGCSGSLMMCGR